MRLHLAAGSEPAMSAILRRLAVYILAAWVAITVSFLLPRVVPGNPVASAVARATQSGNCNSQCILAVEEQLGFDVHKSLWAQYTEYLGNLFQGNLGHSWSENAPVGSLILSYLPWTLVLLGIATAISFVAGTTIGTLVAWRRGSWIDWIMPGATFFQAIPYFFLALVLVLIFGQTGTMLRWFPSLFGYDIYTTTPGLNGPYLASVIAHAILPVATVVLASIAGFLVAMRNQMITTMDEDFVLVAAAKGLPTRTVIWYAARNALLPVIANFTIAISLVVSGQILVEIVFNYPGIGFHLNDALGKLDYSLVQGIFVVITLVVLAANLLADVVYVLIDPRARQIA
jgi:peptide/nickel transport system permease protein